MPTVLEICAGGGGQALGLENAGFEAVGLVENDHYACATLRRNRPTWPVLEADVRTLGPDRFRGVDLVAGGVPCPPFSVAGKQLGGEDERDLFPAALHLVEHLDPGGVLLENVAGFASRRFVAYRRALISRLDGLGYWVDTRILNARDFGVPQLRPRFILVAVKKHLAPFFAWPSSTTPGASVGEVLVDLMASRGWPGAAEWAAGAGDIAPTLVGGSKKHGGADLGPTRARAAWKRLGVNGLSLADAPPGPDFPTGTMPRLTVRMAARIQGFPDTWRFEGGKTAAYRQVGNALPPPVAEAVGRSLRAALLREVPDRSTEEQLVLRYQTA